MCSTATVHASKPARGIDEVLVGAQFVDAYRVAVPVADLDATRAAQAMIEHPPRWVDGLLALRHRLVAPFGLKTSARDAAGGLDTIGLFPIRSATARRVVLGFDDKHLDFRLVVDVFAEDGGSAVTATTVVRLHNVFGRLYLTAIMPFHKAIARTMLKGMARKIGGR
jgi:hypothetical protein